jgi:hypothetical protein
MVTVFYVYFGLVIFFWKGLFLASGPKFLEKFHLWGSHDVFFALLGFINKIQSGGRNNNLSLSHTHTAKL